MSAEEARGEADARRWEWQVARSDEHLLRQVSSLGCDGACGVAVKEALAKRAAARREAMELARKGDIDLKEVGARAARTENEFRREIAGLVTSEVIARLDPEGARAVVVLELRACDEWLAHRVRAQTGDVDYAGILMAVAREIVQLARRYPQLNLFMADTHTSADALRIVYAYRTENPRGGGGWTASVPNPKPDGIWLFIDVHDPDSTAAIHTQPVTPPRCVGAKRVSFLLLDGAETRSPKDAIEAILSRHGIGPCPAP